MKAKNPTKKATLAIFASRGIRQLDYARKTGISPAAVTRMLDTPAKTFTLGRLAQMADLLSLSDAEILTLVDTLRHKNVQEAQDGSNNEDIPDEGSLEECED